jgi:hypothetical protein
MFKGCSSLEYVNLPKNKLSRDKIINQLKQGNIQCKII